MEQTSLDLVRNFLWIFHIEKSPFSEEDKSRFLSNVPNKTLMELAISGRYWPADESAKAALAGRRSLQDVSEFIQMSGNSNDNVREVAISTLGSFLGKVNENQAKSITDCLTRALNDKCGAVRRAAIEGLGRYQGEDVFELLADQAKKDNGDEPAAIEALGRVKTTRSTLALLEVARSGETRQEDVKYPFLDKLLEALKGRKKDSPVFVKAFEDESANVRFLAARALAEMAGGNQKLFLRAAEDDYYRTREVGFQELNKRWPEEAATADAFRKVIAARDGDIIEIALKWICKSEDSQAATLLAPYVNQEEDGYWGRYPFDDDKKTSLLLALGIGKGPEVTKALFAAIEFELDLRKKGNYRNNEVVRTTQRILAEREVGDGDEEILIGILLRKPEDGDNLESWSWDLQLPCCRTLSKIKGARATRALVESVKGERNWWRSDLYELLRSRRTKEDIDVFLSCLGSSDSTIRITAIRALEGVDEDRVFETMKQNLLCESGLGDVLAYLMKHPRLSECTEELIQLTLGESNDVLYKALDALKKIGAIGLLKQRFFQQ